MLSTQGNSMTENLIEVRDLAVEFVTNGQAQRVVTGVSFDVRKGETLALVGESFATAGQVLGTLAFGGIGLGLYAWLLRTSRG